MTLQAIISNHRSRIAAKAREVGSIESLCDWFLATYWDDLEHGFSVSELRSALSSL